MMNSFRLQMYKKNINRMDVVGCGLFAKSFNNKLCITVSDLRLLLMQKTQLGKTKLENNKI